jgi:Large ribosomal RNA subunit accumulation protein YceD
MASAMERHPHTAAEFSRLVLVDRLQDGELVEAITAGEEECAALAGRFGLVALDRLAAKLTLRRIGRGPAVRLEGRLVADVVQTCVLSLEPVASRIEERFAVVYAPEERGPEHAGPVETLVLDSEEDWREPIVGGRIDVGEAVAQQLALALDPYPRKPGVSLEDVIPPVGAGHREGPLQSPFAVLVRLVR